MSVSPIDSVLLNQWIALGGVPDDRSTRDYACELLLKVWADRNQWVATAMELTELHGPLVPRRDSSHAGPGGETASVVRSGVPGALADHDGPDRPADPNPAAHRAPTPENADSRAAPSRERPAVSTQGA